MPSTNETQLSGKIPKSVRVSNNYVEYCYRAHSAKTIYRSVLEDEMLTLLNAGGQLELNTLWTSRQIELRYATALTGD